MQCSNGFRSQAATLRAAGGWCGWGSPFSGSGTSNGDHSCARRIVWQMGELPYTRNELSGAVEGPVVQAGAVRDVYLSPVTTPESAETRRRWEARQRRILDAEDAARERQERKRAEDARILRQLGRRSGLLFVLGLIAIWASRLFPHQREAMGLIASGLFAMAILVLFAAWFVTGVSTGSKR